MPTFRYRALTESGEVVAGSITAATAADVERRIHYLGLVPIEAVGEEQASGRKSFELLLRGKPKAEEITTFTRDLALLLQAGARLDSALELLSVDAESRRLRPIIASIRTSVLGGKSFADALLEHDDVFPPIYEALVRVGEVSGSLDQVLEALAAERARSEQLKRRLTEALQYPAFILCAAGAVLTFFLLFVLPQFASVLRDFGAKLDPIVSFFLFVSSTLRENGSLVLTAVLGVLVLLWLVFRQPAARQSFTDAVAQLPGLRNVMAFHRTALFCRNLSVLTASGMPISSALRILAEMMARTGHSGAWSQVLEQVRHGGKLSDALSASGALPEMAVRMLRLGEETGRLPTLANRVADFYQAKLQRSLDRVVAIAGPAAIITISIVVGGLIVSVMTSLLSVNQLVQ